MGAAYLDLASQRPAAERAATLMLGVAVLALGITWAMARNDADRLSRYLTGFVLYNVGVGLLFGWAALAASHPTLPWIVCAVHVMAGAAVGVLGFKRQVQP